MRLHDNGDVDGRAQSLEQDVAERLKNRVRDEEDGQCGIVPGCGKIQVCAKAGDFGIANVGPVEEGQQIEEAELRPTSVQVWGSPA